MDIRQAIGFITGKAAKHPYPEHIMHHLLGAGSRARFQDR